jgi:protein-tyrosine phosphatase
MIATPHPQSTVLFLCSGNYYRSRFAEHLFNTQIQDTGLPWTANSRGLITDRLDCNIGPISHYAVNGLIERGISVPEPLRFPIQLLESDLAAAALVIALKEAEHRSLLTERFPQWPDHVEYWHIHDLDCALPTATLTALTREVTQLIQRLQTQIT